MRQAMMQANVTYLLTAMSLTAHAALQQFRYRSSDTYYSAGDSLGSQNFWQLLNNVWNYFTIAYMGIASLTQLLSMLGIAAEINVMVWMYGSMVDGVIALVTSLVAMYAYDAYWTVSQDSTSSNQANAATALAALEDDLLHVSASSTAAGVGLYIEHEAWMMAQFMALPKETQDKWMAEKEGKKGEGNMLALFQI